jgi:hypothetical protein
MTVRSLDAQDTRGGDGHHPWWDDMVPTTEDLDDELRKLARHATAEVLLGKSHGGDCDRLSGVLHVLVEIPVPTCCLNWSGHGSTIAVFTGTMCASTTISSLRLLGDERK